MSNKVELNKNGRPVGWHGQSWAYYKGMMKLTFENKDVLDYATEGKVLAASASVNEVKAFQKDFFGDQAAISCFSLDGDGSASDEKSNWHRDVKIPGILLRGKD